MSPNILNFESTIRRNVRQPRQARHERNHSRGSLMIWINKKVSALGMVMHWSNLLEYLRRSPDLPAG